MATKISDIMHNAVLADANETKYDKELVKAFISSIRLSNDLFKEALEVDLKNNNGEELDFEVIDSILNKYENSEVLINSNKLIYKDNKLLSSSVYDKQGIVLVCFDGNPYVLIEMICLGLLTHNTMIFNYNGYMRGVNGLTISLIESILEKENIDKNKYQLIEAINNKDLLNNRTIDKTIAIGVDVKGVSSSLKISGYKNYDLYIESLEHIGIIEKILSTGLNIYVYLKEGLELNYEDMTIVGDIDEAISRINSEGARYCSAIFSSDVENASKFLREVKSSTVMYNASPTLERALDVTQEDLLKVKNIVVPDNLRLDGKRIEI